MMRVGIGIHVQGGPGRLEATLAHLEASTPAPFDILLLPDGAEAGLQLAAPRRNALPRAATGAVAGAAACFNRMLRTLDSDLMIFLEAGVLVGPGWLALIQAALQADGRNGLAGPSTNRAWNRQAAFPTATEANIRAVAAQAAARFGQSWQGLEPLHCLADFCYAVRRDVVEAIGGADEAYGSGPCWEMDYTVRAARAGFRAVWAQGAFVYRRPVSARRRQEEGRFFSASRRRYQEKFCGLRLAGTRTADALHCQGDACPHFAPADRIEIRLPLAAAPASAAPPSPAPADPPLASCIMPTRDRRHWMRQAITYFQRQDYGPCELIIIDDGDTDSRTELPDDPRIRYFHSVKRLSIGAKRNRACELAKGSIIVHWDDDDWYAPGRLTAQVAPLLAGTADITGLRDTIFFDLGNAAFWRATPELYRRLFVHGVHGGTLAYRRDVFERLARFPDSSLAEDAVFLNMAIARGARLQAVAGADLFLYLRHASNAWAFACGTYLDGRGWQRIDEPPCLAADRAFYAARSPAGRLSGPAGAPLPLVSCIMPTHDRRAFVPRAIDYFLRQDYPNIELVILDDGDDPVADLVPDHPSLRYTALGRRLRLGAKRNAAVEAAKGEIIVHWDDDDWSDEARVSTQVSALLAAEADICGTSQVLFCEIATGRLSTYCYPASQRRWLYGASLCYRRSLWRQKPFEAVDVGEDTRFVWAQPQGRLLDLQAQRLLVAIVHGRNTSSPRPLSGPNWLLRPDHARAILGNDWPFYEGLGRSSATAVEPPPSRQASFA